MDAFLGYCTQYLTSTLSTDMSYDMSNVRDPIGVSHIVGKSITMSFD